LIKNEKPTSSNKSVGFFIKMKNILFLLLFSLTAFSQNTSIYFEKKFGTALNDISRSVKQLNSGSIFILGNSNSGNIGNGDISLTKLDQYGNWLWTEYYGTANTENGFYLNTTNDGNFVFVAESETSFNDLDMLIYKVDTNGVVIWNKDYSTSVNESPNYIEATSDAGYIICGYQNDAWGSNNSLVLKLDANGDYQWHQSLGEDQNDYSKMIHELPTGNFILTADTRSYGAQQIDVAIYELNASGQTNWLHLHGDTLVNGCQGLILTTDNKYLSFGETEIYPNSPFNFFVEKMDAAGTVLWHYTYGLSQYADAAFSAIEAADGGFVITGYSNSYNNGLPLDLIIFKIDVNGNFLWQQTYGSEGIDIGYEIIRSTIANGYVITGYTTNPINLTQDYYLLQLNENGLTQIENASSTSSKNISVFPNPATNNCVIKLSNTLIQKITLKNAHGAYVKQWFLTNKSNSESIDLSDISSGIYFLEVIDIHQNIAHQKLIKQ
jgi:Secretion system C-terminal sorting domain